MKLIFIYGPPAVGKLTVAEELTALSGFKLFHNHLTLDLIKHIYPEHDHIRFKLVDKIRLNVFEYTVKNGTNLIFTYAYDGDEYETQFIKDAHNIVTKHDGQVHFVQLRAPKTVLLERLENESRKKFHKLTSFLYTIR